MIKIKEVMAVINCKNVNTELITYIEKNILPEYNENDKGHGILHILEVIRRSFELKESKFGI